MIRMSNVKIIVIKKYFTCNLIPINFNFAVSIFHKNGRQLAKNDL